MPRVSSPWLKPLESADTTKPLFRDSHLINDLEPTAYLDGTGHVVRLEAEPQDGPVEYKLHLLLRSRRNYTYMSTVTHISGSRHSKYNGPPRTPSEAATPTPSVLPTCTQQTRQHRFEQLTTQLLWRLQQSSPHHSASATNLVLPQLPESTLELQPPQQPIKVQHGLEESQGALYEIGVSDDGTLVGLAEDEMQDSLNNLRAMAASLGCLVEVKRMVKVGTCTWKEFNQDTTDASSVEREGDLFVAEALVQPNLVPDTETELISGDNTPAEQLPSDNLPARQLRISLTGATMSGKSSLLGTLSTTTLDNGRGKSRLSMLKHRHEITSGVTSSVTQELIGYSDQSQDEVKVINYASEGVSSWIDIHASSANGRLVFISDSAGHPRYRRTTVRGLVGWNPHWVLLCIPADDEGQSSGKAGSTPPSSEVLGPAAGDVDLSAAHLDLCLRLQLPLVVVITKLDLASKTGLRATLAKLLSVLKSAGKKPILLPNSPGTVSEAELQSFSQEKTVDIRLMMDSLVEDPLSAVPIIMTSALQGAGFDNLHAVLNELPIPEIPSMPVRNSDVQNSIFHVEDIYNKALDADAIIISGHLCKGTVSTGEELFLGPCLPSTGDDSEDSDSQQRPRISQALPTSRSFPGAFKSFSHIHPFLKASDQEWRRVKVASIRNLRLPVSTLHPDQAGTIALQLADHKTLDTWNTVKTRRGMVLCRKPAPTTSTIVAQFRREDLGTLAIGSQVVLYIASIRSSARILSCRTPEPSEVVADESQQTMDTHLYGSESLREKDAIGDKVAGAITHHFLQVTFHFDSTKEFIELRSRILVMPGGGPGLFGVTERGEKGAAGLEGFVGTIVEVL